MEQPVFAGHGWNPAHNGHHQVDAQGTLNVMILGGVDLCFVQIQFIVA
jgi:hypothetical protein